MPSELNCWSLTFSLETPLPYFSTILSPECLPDPDSSCKCVCSVWGSICVCLASGVEKPTMGVEWVIRCGGGSQSEGSCGSCSASVGQLHCSKDTACLRIWELDMDIPAGPAQNTTLSELSIYTCSLKPLLGNVSLLLPFIHLYNQWTTWTTDIELNLIQPYTLTFMGSSNLSIFFPVGVPWVDS